VNSARSIVSGLSRIFYVLSTATSKKYGMAMMFVSHYLKEKKSDLIAVFLSMVPRKLPMKKNQIMLPPQ
jgi:hypothetical protein